MKLKSQIACQRNNPFNMPSHWYSRMPTSLHRRRTKHVKGWNLPRVLRSIVFPVGEEAEISFWVSWLRISLPCTCLMSAVLLWGIWIRQGGQWKRPPDYQSTWWPGLVYTWDCLCGAEALSCASFRWLLPVTGTYCAMLGFLMIQIWI